MYLKREDYHGGSFNDNGRRKLLMNIAVLEEISPPEALNEDMTSCYGKDLAPNYKAKIGIFKKCYRKLHAEGACGFSPRKRDMRFPRHHEFRKSGVR